MKRENAQNIMNSLGENATPFFFIIDYEMNNCEIFNADDAFDKGILFNFNNSILNYKSYIPDNEVFINKEIISFDEYEKAFDSVQEHLHRGNSYLVNLTFETPIKLNATLADIFHCSKAKYKLLYQNNFVVFSPETFVRISGKEISTYPMKGTIDASVPNAKNEILNNEKEQAEHATIVDLLRNDLSRVATNVNVESFRYIDKITSNDKELLQVSSKITGKLPDNYTENIGDIIFSMLPAGSITGAPKDMTLSIINEAETYKRGYYTGIAGYFDGENLDSCVLIRFIENKNGNLTYKSGGGITTQSIAIDEYNELINKIYVPTN